MTQPEFSERDLRKVLRRELVAAAIEMHESLRCSPDTLSRRIVDDGFPCEDHPAAKRANRYAECGIDARQGDSGKAWTKSTIQSDLDAINAGEEPSPSHAERVEMYTAHLHEIVGHLNAEFGREESGGEEPGFMPMVRELFDYLVEQ